MTIVSVSLQPQNTLNKWFYIHRSFKTIMSSAMLPGIVVLSLTKAVKVHSLCTFVILYEYLNTILLQIYCDSSGSWLVWFIAYNA